MFMPKSRAIFLSSIASKALDFRLDAMFIPVQFFLNNIIGVSFGTDR